MPAARQSAKITFICPQPLVVVLTADVGLARGMVVGAVIIHMVCSSRSEVSALLALGTPLFNGDCVAGTSATRCRSIEFRSSKALLHTPQFRIAICGPGQGPRNSALR